MRVSLKSDSRPMLREQAKEWQELDEGNPKQQQALKHGREVSSALVVSLHS